MIFSLPGPYLRYTRSVPCFLSSMRRKFLMKPSSLRISVMRSLSLEDGMSTFSCSARLALRMRVRRSAIGSLIDMSGSSPAGLDHARHLALEGELAEAEAAELELSDEAARAPAQLAAVVDACLELGGLVQALRLHNERGLGHALGLPEGNAQMGEERLGLLVGVGRGDHDHVHAAYLVHLVEHDLREDHLLLETEGVVPAAVEGLGGHTLEVAYAGKGDIDESIEELVHARPAQGHLAADGRVLAQLEVGDGLLGPRHHRLLSRDGEEVRHREVEDLGILLALAHAHVEHDLLEARHLEGVAVAPLLHHGGDHRRPEPVAPAPGHPAGPCPHPAEPCRPAEPSALASRLRLPWPYTLSMNSPDRRATRAFLPSASARTPTRVGLSVCGSTSITFDRWIVPSRSMMPPCRSFWVGRWCFLIILMCSMSTRPLSRITRRTLPFFPRSLPATTMTVSPFRTCACAMPVLR